MTSNAYASVSFSETGPAKTFADLAAIQRHNNREEPLDHVVEGAPSPEHLIGSGNLRADVRQVCDDAGIDPDRRRANGALAQEVVFSADHDWFACGTPEEQELRLKAWVRVTLAFLRAHWDRRLASVVLHRDEYTPHLHVVVVPLHTDVAEQVPPKWRLVIREVNGPGRWAQAHTDYAAAVAHLGLVRGKVGSERKRKPYGDLLRDLKEREEAADAAMKKAMTIQREAALKLLDQINEEHRLRHWETALRMREEALTKAETSILAREVKMAAAFEMADKANAAAAAAQATAEHNLFVATKLRDLVMSAQAAAISTLKAAGEHERATPSPTLVNLIDQNRTLQAASRVIKTTIEADDDLLMARNLAWGADRRTGRG